jgi:hypothetical protein
MSYHPRRSDREIKDEHTIRAMLHKGKYAIIGLSVNDEPYVVTLSYAYDADTHTLYFHGGKEGQKIDFIRSNPRACATIIEDDGFDTDICDFSYKSLVIRGTIELIDNLTEIDTAMKLMIYRHEKKDQEHFFAKLHPGNNAFDTMQMMRMKIKSVTGKRRG